MENNRLWKRLSEINNRKNKFLIDMEQESELLSSNAKSREICRLQKNKEIQHENDMFVERLVHRLNSHHSIFSSLEDRRSKGRKKSRKNESVVLPSILGE